MPAGLLATHVDDVLELGDLLQAYLPADARLALLAVARRRVSTRSKLERPVLSGQLSWEPSVMLKAAKYLRAQLYLSCSTLHKQTTSRATTGVPGRRGPSRACGRGLDAAGRISIRRHA